MKITRKGVKHMLEIYHPYASLAVVSTLVVAKALGIPGVEKSFSVSYQTTKDDQVHHSKGYDDMYLVFFLLNIVTIIRFFYRKVVLEPIANKLGMSKGLTAKFVEAGWFGIYYLVATAWGYVVFRDDPWWFSTRNLWDGYPHTLDFDMKLYYLSSLAFWLQSLLSFSFEPPRKDDVAMTFHHFLTVSLISSSYITGFCRVGAAILMEQNAADIIYYHSKVFKYAKLELLSTIGWVSFVFIWFYTRHIVFGAILVSVWEDMRVFIPYEWSFEKEHLLVPVVYYGFLIGLILLQGLMVFWFTMILKVAYRVVTGQGEIKDTTEYLFRGVYIWGPIRVVLVGLTLLICPIYSDEELEAKQKESRPSPVRSKKISPMYSDGATTKMVEVESKEKRA